MFQSVMKGSATAAAVSLGLLSTACAVSPSVEPPPVPAIVPRAEQHRAQERQVAGPTASRGIEAVKVLGTVALAAEFEGAGDRVLRVRELVIAIGGVVAVHEHDRRPGVAYVLEGEMTEFRGERGEPIVHAAGSAAFERSGVIHWWENRGATPARALVVDIVPAP